MYLWLFNHNLELWVDSGSFLIQLHLSPPSIFGQPTHCKELQWWSRWWRWWLKDYDERLKGAWLWMTKSRSWGPGGLQLEVGGPKTSSIWYLEFVSHLIFRICASPLSSACSTCSTITSTSSTSTQVMMMTTSTQDCCPKARFSKHIFYENVESLSYFARLRAPPFSRSTSTSPNHLSGLPGASHTLTLTLNSHKYIYEYKYK